MQKNNDGKNFDIPNHLTISEFYPPFHVGPLESISMRADPFTPSLCSRKKRVVTLKKYNAALLMCRAALFMCHAALRIQYATP